MIFFVWFFFIFGEVCHTAFQLISIVRATNNTAYSWTRIVKDRWLAFLIRFVSASMLFWIFLGGELATALSIFSVETPSWLKLLNAFMNTKLGPPFAWFIGLAVDNLMAFIPVLKSYLPKVDDPIPTIVSQTETKVTGTKVEVHTHTDVIEPVNIDE